MAQGSNTKTGEGEAPLALRDVTREDLPLFFAHQQDVAANYMAAFTAKDPADWTAFLAHWTRILNDDANTIRTILYDGKVIGYVTSLRRWGAGKSATGLTGITGAGGWQQGRWRSFCANLMCVPSLRGRSKTMWPPCGYWKNVGL